MTEELPSDASRHRGLDLGSVPSGALLDAMGEGVTLVDPDGRIVFSNRAAERILGVTASAEPAEAWSDHYGVFLPDQVTRFPAGDYPLVRALRGEETDGVEMWISNPALPEGAWIAVTGRPLRDAKGTITGAVVVFRNITALRRAERELARANQELHGSNLQLGVAYRELQAAQSQLVHSAKMASLGELVAGVAHELNNPLAFCRSHLTTVRSRLERMRSAGPADEVAASWSLIGDRLTELDAGLIRIGDLVTKLRTFSRLDQGQLGLTRIRDDIAAVLTILRHRLGNDITVTTTFAEPERVPCYPALLNQALLNIVSNAIDAVAGQGRIHVHAGAEGASFVVRVEDTGSGIAEELQERVFEPFFTTKPVGSGTGLGLSITYAILVRHGGTVSLTPNQPRGTVATLRWPLDLLTSPAHDR